MSGALKAFLGGAKWDVALFGQEMGNKKDTAYLTIILMVLYLIFQ